MNKKDKKLKAMSPDCMTCSNCIPIGEGDHICYEGGPLPAMVISEYAPTAEYMACGGKHFET